LVVAHLESALIFGAGSDEGGVQANEAEAQAGERDRVGPPKMTPTRSQSGREVEVAPLAPLQPFEISPMGDGLVIQRVALKNGIKETTDIAVALLDPAVHIVIAGHQEDGRVRQAMRARERLQPGFGALILVCRETSPAEGDVAGDQYGLG
jgi:hypothetical protein